MVDNPDAQREIGLNSIELRKYDKSEIAFKKFE